MVLPDGDQAVAQAIELDGQEGKHVRDSEVRKSVQG